MSIITATGKITHAPFPGSKGYAFIEVPGLDRDIFVNPVICGAVGLTTNDIDTLCKVTYHTDVEDEAQRYRAINVSPGGAGFDDFDPEDLDDFDETVVSMITRMAREIAVLQDQVVRLAEQVEGSR